MQGVRCLTAVALTFTRPGHSAWGALSYPAVARSPAALRSECVCSVSVGCGVLRVANRGRQSIRCACRDRPARHRVVRIRVRSDDDAVDAAADEVPASRRKRSPACISRLFTDVNGNRAEPSYIDVCTAGADSRTLDAHRGRSGDERGYQQHRGGDSDEQSRQRTQRRECQRHHGSCDRGGHQQPEARRKTLAVANACVRSGVLH